MKHLIVTIFLCCCASFANAQSGNIHVKKAEKDSNQIQAYLMIVEEMPEFPGGANELSKFISTNIQYPATAKENGIEGIVYVNFIIETDGSIRNIRVLRGIPRCPECDLEALRVTRLMPAWKPGKQRGKTVPVSFALPIKFTIN
jgi:protein TonB